MALDTGTDTGIDTDIDIGKCKESDTGKDRGTDIHMRKGLGTGSHTALLSISAH